MPILTAYALHLPGLVFGLPGLAHSCPRLYVRGFYELTRFAAANYFVEGQPFSPIANDLLRGVSTIFAIFF